VDSELQATLSEHLLWGFWSWMPPGQGTVTRFGSSCHILMAGPLLPFHQKVGRWTEKGDFDFCTWQCHTRFIPELQICKSTSTVQKRAPQHEDEGIHAFYTHTHTHTHTHARARTHAHMGIGFCQDTGETLPTHVMALGDSANVADIGIGL
jgi:hypothetical protein